MNSDVKLTMVDVKWKLEHATNDIQRLIGELEEQMYDLEEGTEEHTEIWNMCATLESLELDINKTLKAVEKLND